MMCCGICGGNLTISDSEIECRRCHMLVDSDKTRTHFWGGFMWVFPDNVDDALEAYELAQVEKEFWGGMA